MTTIAIEDRSFHDIVATLHVDGLTPAAAQAIAQLAQLVAGVDLDDDPEERDVVAVLSRQVCGLAGIAAAEVPPVSPLPLDAEERRAWIADLTRPLDTPGARELAFAVAYLASVADLELAPKESALLAELQRALAIDQGRAGDLAELASTSVTPAVRAAG